MSDLHIVRLDDWVSPPPIFPPSFTHKYTSHHNTPRDTATIIARIQDADVVISTLVPLNAETIEKCSIGKGGRLRLIAVFAIGYDMVDLDACKAFGVEVRNVRGASVESVGEHALGFYFGLRRNVIGLHNILTQTTEWTEKGNCTAQYFGGHPRTLKEEIVGIIGVGELGTRVATIFKSLGSKVLLAERTSTDTPRPGRTPLLSVLSSSSVLMITTALTPETHNLISAPELALLPKDAIIINVARGGIVNEADLVTALKEGRIAGAATDVFEVEPTGREGNVLVRTAGELGGRLVVSPHVAWYAKSSLDKLRRVTGENIVEWTRGEKGKNVVC